MLDVPDVAFHAFGYLVGVLDLTAETCYLRPSRDAGLDPMADHEIVYLLGVFFGMLHHVGTGAYNGHVAQKDIEELGYLVDVGPTHEVANLGLAGIFLGGLLLVGFFVLAHAAELVYPEFLAVKAVALLLENDGAFGSAFDEQTYNDIDKGEDETNEYTGYQYIKCPFDKLATFSTEFVTVCSHVSIIPNK